MNTVIPTRADLLAALQPITDPELGFSIVDLGLIYDVGYDPATQAAHVLMTLTSPACPLTDQFKQAITAELTQLPGVTQVELEFTFTPRWSAEQATDDIKQ